jgi:hypothetical protein
MEDKTLKETFEASWNDFKATLPSGLSPQTIKLIHVAYTTGLVSSLLVIGKISNSLAACVNNNKVN